MDCMLPKEIQDPDRSAGPFPAAFAPYIFGPFLQYKAMDVQRVQLLAQALPDGTCCTDGCPDPKTLRLTSSLAILSSLLGFQKQTEQINAQTAALGVCPDQTETTLGTIVLLVAVTRFFRLLEENHNDQAENASQQEKTAKAAE